jgi:phosphomannomutase
LQNKIVKDKISFLAKIFLGQKTQLIALTDIDIYIFCKKNAQVMTDYSKFFKAYDIRGTVPELNAELYYWAGFGLVKEILQPENLPLEVNITHDGRYSSEEFYTAFVHGITDAGGKPICLGLGSTDTAYAASQYNTFAGVSLTASHNPKDDNGLKVLKTGSTMLGIGSGLEKIRDFVVARMGTNHTDFKQVSYPTTDESTKTKVMNHFKGIIRKLGEIDRVDEILSSRNQKLIVPVDAGNGTGGFVMEFIKDFYKNIEFVPMYWEVDGNFPNHPADPQDTKTLVDLQAKVIELKSRFGFAFDGDADRVGFVDEMGKIVCGDYLVAFLAKTLLEANKRNPHPTLSHSAVYIQPGSRCVIEAITEQDGIAIPSTQGHTGIKDRMTKHKALYGGEFSGHHYFGEFGYLDSGVITAVLMIKICVEQDKPMSKMFESLSQSYFISDLMNLTIPEGQDFEMWKQKIKAHFTDATISEFDGISVFYPDWKFSMRSSKTEPKVRFILESRINNTTEQKVQMVKNLLGI